MVEGVHHRLLAARPPGLRFALLGDPLRARLLGPVALGAGDPARGQARPPRAESQRPFLVFLRPGAGERAPHGVGHALGDLLTLRQAAPLEHLEFLLAVKQHVRRLVAGGAAQADDGQLLAEAPPQLQRGRRASSRRKIPQAARSPARSTGSPGPQPASVPSGS